MKLFVNGCSHTKGTEVALDGDLTQAWPYKLQEMLQYQELNNNSWVGSSNDRIVRTTIEGIVTSAIPPDLAVIQFTDPYRFETPEDKTDGYKQFLPNTYQAEEYRDVFVAGPIDKSFCKKHYNISNNLQRRLVQDKMLTQILGLQNLFENYDIPFVFIIWWKLIDGLESTSLFRSIHKSNILNYDNISNTLIPMDTILHSHGHELCNQIRPDGTRDKHYMSIAQQFLAESIFKFATYGEHLLCEGDIGDHDYQEVHHHYD